MSETRTYRIANFAAMMPKIPIELIKLEKLSQGKDVL